MPAAEAKVIENGKTVGKRPVRGFNFSIICILYLGLSLGT